MSAPKFFEEFCQDFSKSPGCSMSIAKGHDRLTATIALRPALRPARTITPAAARAVASDAFGEDIFADMKASGA